MDMSDKIAERVKNSFGQDRRICSVKIGQNTRPLLATNKAVIVTVSSGSLRDLEREGRLISMSPEGIPIEYHENSR